MTINQPPIRPAFSRFAIVGLLLTSVATLSGCANDAQNGALLGGLLGAGTGAVIGHQSDEAWTGAGIGAAAGALGGYLIGNEMDKDPRRSNNKRPQYDY